MFNIADDYGLIHKYYPETTDNNPNDEKWEKLYQRKIQSAELEKEQILLSTPYIKKRSKLKQIRLHLNAGITRMGFVTLNDVFKKQYFHKKDHEAVILVDGFVDDFKKITEYKQWLNDCSLNETEFVELGIAIKEMDQEIKSSNTTNKLSNDMRTKYTVERKKMVKEKEKLI